MPVTLYFVFRSSIVQTFITQKITSIIEKQYDIHSTIQGVDISFRNGLVLEKMFVADASQDTLLFFNELHVKLQEINLQQQHIELQKIALQQPSIRLQQDATGTLNLQYLLDKFDSNEVEDTTSSTSAWTINFNHIQLQQAALRYRVYRPDSLAYGINFDDLDINDLNVDLRNVSIGEEIRAAIHQFSFREKCGFTLSHLSAEACMSDSLIDLQKLILKTNNTALITKYLKFAFTDFSAFSDFLTKVKLDVAFRDSTQIDFKDITYFASDLQGMNLKTNLKGRIHGTINNLHGDSVELAFGQHTHLQSSFHIAGLPEMDTTFIRFDAEKLITEKSDLEQIRLPAVPEGEALQLPGMITHLGVIRYTGDFEGKISDFNTSGILQSNIGRLTAKAGIKTDTASNTIHIDSRLNLSRMHVGKLLDAGKYVGELTLDAQISGAFYENGAIAGAISSKINQAVLNGYPCNNIAIDGEFTDRSFDGSVIVTDPNLKLGFLGKCDFAPKIPVFQFSSAIYNANLYELNLLEDSLASIGLFLDANFKGSNIDNLSGKIEFDDLVYKQNNGEIKAGKFYFSVNEKTDSIKNLTLVSDFVNADITGQYLYESLMEDLKDFMYNYLPAFSDYKPKNKKQKRTIKKTTATSAHANNFRFDIKIKEINQLLRVFMPDLSIQPNTMISGNYTSKNQYLAIVAKSDSINYDENVFENIRIKAYTYNNKLFFNTKTKGEFFSEGVKDNISLLSQIKKDSVQMRIKWQNSDTTASYRSNISLLTVFTKKTDSSLPKIDIRLYESDLIIGDTLWSLAPARISIDTTYISINDFSLRNNSQFININGSVSDNKNDSLIIDIQDVNLSAFNQIAAGTGVSFAGILSGKTTLFNLYKSPLIFTNDSIIDLTVNNNRIGNLYIKSEWDNIHEKLHCEIYTLRGILKSFWVTGDYYQKNNALDFNIGVDKFPLNIVETFTEDIISAIRGRAYGDFKLKGTLDKPLFNGTMKLQKCAFTVDYMKTRYNFTDSFYITNNAFIFKDLRIFSSDRTIVNGWHGRKAYERDSIELHELKNANTAMLNGKITHKNFDDIRLDVTLNPNRFLMMNTTHEDNELFYGTAYGTGVIHVEGPTDDLKVDISMRTDKNTAFFIPLTWTEEVSEDQRFIRFVNTSKKEVRQQDEYKVDLSDIELNFNLDVNPDAEVQLIMDEKVGDIIKARGYADLRMMINMSGAFEMYGTYEIQQGDYLFTLENIINKKFEVQKGGTIKWTGDPIDADIDLNAVYKITKVPLYDLVLEPNTKEMRVPVSCILMMENKLMNPDIKFDIKLPGNQVDRHIKSQVNNLPSDELNKQILSLLVLNRFQPLPGLSSGVQYGGAVSSNAYEVLTNQLNHWLSQINKDFDIGVNYRPGDELTSDQLEVALSTQLFNDRVNVELNSNLGLGNEAAESTDTPDEQTKQAIVGDVKVEYKITEDGQLRAKYEATTNDRMLSEDDALYTHSLGLFYTEDFNSFGELISKYKHKIRQLYNRLFGDTASE